eukprot:365246-Chlamydomonas_euryale.AAC.9
MSSRSHVVCGGCVVSVFNTCGAPTQNSHGSPAAVPPTPTPSPTPTPTARALRDRSPHTATRPPFTRQPNRRTPTSSGGHRPARCAVAGGAHDHHNPAAANAPIRRRLRHAAAPGTRARRLAARMGTTSPRAALPRVQRGRPAPRLPCAPRRCVACQPAAAHTPPRAHALLGI